MVSRIFAAIFVFTSLAGFTQSIDSTKVATVHVYRQGRLLVETSLFADGNPVVSLTPYESATFYLHPGQHELAMQSGEISPSVSFLAEMGQEYWFRLNYEHVVSATSLRDLSVSLSMQRNIPDCDEIREVTIEQSKLLEILEKSGPRRLPNRFSRVPDERPRAAE